jgi:hypothetical protein
MVGFPSPDLKTETDPVSIVFSICLEIRMMDRVHIPIDSEYIVDSSEQKCLLH